MESPPIPPRIAPLRRLVVSMLVGMLASCPILCGSAGEVLGLHHGHDAHHAGGDNPGSIPTNDDDCVCNGALITAHTPTHHIRGLDDGAPDLPFDLWLALIGLTGPVELAPVPSLLDSGLAPSAQPAAITGCAWLQNFRC